MLLERVTLNAKEALEFVKLAQALNNEIVDAEKREKLAAAPIGGVLAGAMNPAPPKDEILSSDNTKPTRKIRRAVDVILHEAKKQQEKRK
jgi:hypothetical protein